MSENMKAIMAKRSIILVVMSLMLVIGVKAKAQPRQNSKLNYIVALEAALRPPSLEVNLFGDVTWDIYLENSRYQRARTLFRQPDFEKTVRSISQEQLKEIIDLGFRFINEKPDLHGPFDLKKRS